MSTNTNNTIDIRNFLPDTTTATTPIGWWDVNERWFSMETPQKITWQCRETDQGYGKVFTPKEVGDFMEMAPQGMPGPIWDAFLEERVVGDPQILISLYRQLEGIREGLSFTQYPLQEGCIVYVRSTYTYHRLTGRHEMWMSVRFEKPTEVPLTVYRKRLVTG